VRKTVRVKQALFHEVFTGVTYTEARKRLVAAAAKTGVKDPAAK